MQPADARQVEEHDISTFYEYAAPFSSHTVGVSVVRGRYPQNGYDADEAIDQTWYVASGVGQIGIGGRTYDLRQGSMVYVPKGTRYFIEGTLSLVVVSIPPWSPEQHKHFKSTL